jgi:hypothetical protein
MGAWLTNLTLRDAQPGEVVAWMKQRRRSAFISKSFGRCIVVCDEESDGMDPAVMAAFAAELSAGLGCTALAASVADSDVLRLLLLESGQSIMEYNSCPAYFDEGGPDFDLDEADIPAGADAPALCHAFGSEKIDELQATLDQRLPDGPGSASTQDPDSLVGIFAEFRLAKVARLLGLPEIIWRVSYGYLMDEIAQGTTTPGLNLADFTKCP